VGASFKEPLMAWLVGSVKVCGDCGMVDNGPRFYTFLNTPAKYQYLCLKISSKRVLLIK